MTLLEVQGLRVAFGKGPDAVEVVRGVDFCVGEGEAVGMVGASGCGKSVTALSLMGLLPPRVSRVSSGSSIRFQGRELVGMPARRLRRYRGRGIAMVFQEPMTSLNPVHSVGRQVAEAVRAGGQVRSRREAWARAVELLAEVGIPDPGRRARDLPHQFSGGMRQRVGIAMALAPDPNLLVADEPTTALDVTIQARILELLEALLASRDMSLLLISHDLAVVARSCGRVLVMDGGRLVEEGPVEALFSAPRHPVTRTLVEAVPGSPASVADAAASPFRTASASFPRGLPSGGEGDGGDGGGDGEGGDGAGGLPILEAVDLVKHFPRSRSPWFTPRRAEASDSPGPGTAPSGSDALRAVDGVSLALHPGRTLALVGESGAGKTTVARCLLRLVEADGGQILFRGRPVGAMAPPELRAFRRQVQLVFQDPSGSLNPRLSVGSALDEVLRVHGLAGDARGRAHRVGDLLERVGLPGGYRSRLPHQLSGGERQRVGIARALAVEPRILICDEPVSSLDVHVRRRILDLLMDLRRELDLACLLIAHDLGVVAELADRVAVMYLGRVLEEGPVERVLGDPRHPYTRALLAAVPRWEPRRPEG
ncbi:MAG: ABC transporter ATP-binding protein [Gemmatimonadales bacterium]|nr:MAG: ABC transporter ATP-binding protein [Gemmatimonadales bacterium]